MRTHRFPILIILAIVAGCTLSSGGQEADLTDPQLSLQALVASEFATDDGGWTQLGTLPNRVRSGDRLWVAANVDNAAHVYVVGSKQIEYSFFLLGKSEPQPADAAQPRQVLPGGLVLSQPQTSMSALFVVASLEPLHWLEGLEPTTCEQYLGIFPPDEPSDPCGHLANLYFKGPRDRRGPYRPIASVIAVDGRELVAESKSFASGPFVIVKLPIGDR